MLQDNLPASLERTTYRLAIGVLPFRLGPRHNDPKPCLHLLHYLTRLSDLQVPRGFCLLERSRMSGYVYLTFMPLFKADFCTSCSLVIWFSQIRRVCLVPPLGQSRAKIETFDNNLRRYVDLTSSPDFSYANDYVRDKKMKQDAKIRGLWRSSDSIPMAQAIALRAPRRYHEIPRVLFNPKLLKDHRFIRPLTAGPMSASIPAKIQIFL